MKKFKTLTNAIALSIILVGGLLSSCSDQAPFAPNGNDSEIQLGKKHQKTSGVGTTSTSTITVVETGSVTLRYDSQKKQYGGGWILLKNGAYLFIEPGSLTPPKGTRKGDPVTITMTLEKDTEFNELIYSFEPHGSTFSPEAHLVLSFTNLSGSGTVSLFYLDADRNHTEVIPDQWDMIEQLAYLRIPHFSRYAVAWSR